MDDIVDALKSVDLLAGLSRKHLNLIARVTERIDLAPDTTLIEEGQVMTHMSILITGAATVTVGGAQVGVVGPGDVLGELGMVDPAPASATVTTTEPTTIWHMSRVGFLPVWEKNRGDMAPAMLSAVIKKLRETNKRASGSDL